MLEAVSRTEAGVTPIRLADGGEDPTVREFSANEEDLIQRLRKEANTATDTFTKYVFQTLSISGVALGAIIEFMFFMPVGNNSGNANNNDVFHPLQPIVGLAAFPILIFALAVCRIGTYYYTDSNRQFGFELFLSRMRLAPTNLQGRWKASYIHIDWEEAMRAWRVVQETLFHKIHPRERLLRRHIYADTFKPDPKTNPQWFCQASLFGANSTAVWKAGKFLDTMQLLLLFVASIASIILWLVPIMTIFPGDRYPLVFYFFNQAIWSNNQPECSVLLLLAAIFIAGVMVFFDTWRDRTPARLWAAALAVVSLIAMMFTLKLFEILAMQDQGKQLRDLMNISGWLHPGEFAARASTLVTLFSSHSASLHLGGLFGHTEQNRNPAGSLLSVFTVLVAMLSSLAIWLSARNERARRSMLKDGILSLHSCSIVWEAVVVAHFSAIERARRCGIPSWELAKLTWPSLGERLFGSVPSSMWTAWQEGRIQFEDIIGLLHPDRRHATAGGADLPGYTFWLGQEASSLARWAHRVPSWIGIEEKELHDSGKTIGPQGSSDGGGVRPIG